MIFQRLLKRVRHGIRWRLTSIRFRRDRLLGAFGPFWFTNVHWPWPLLKPFERKTLRLLAPGGGLGDALMCTPIFNEIKKLNPRCHLTFVTHYPDVFENHPRLDNVEICNEENKRGAVRLAYQHLTPPPRPIITIMAECVGLHYASTQLDRLQVAVSDEFAKKVATFERPLIVVQTRSSDWTPNKDWPAHFWQELAAKLSQHFSVIEVGKTSCIRNAELGPRFYSYVGQTSVAEFLYIIDHADVFVGPVSAGMHAANGSRVLSVIIYGGYESPLGQSYPRSIDFYTNVSCAPCWLTTACPYELKCLHAISPENVYDAVCRQVELRNKEMKAGTSAPP